MKRGRLIAVVAALLLIVAAAGLVPGRLVHAGGPLQEERTFIVPEGASLTSIAAKLEEEGLIPSAKRLPAARQILRRRTADQGGRIPATGPGRGQPDPLDSAVQTQVIRRLITIPEGMPSIMVHERLMAEKLLTGDIPVPREGSVLPDSYDFQRGETRAAVLATDAGGHDEAAGRIVGQAVARDSRQEPGRSGDPGLDRRKGDRRRLGTADGRGALFQPCPLRACCSRPIRRSSTR